MMRLAMRRNDHINPADKRAEKGMVRGLGEPEPPVDDISFQSW